MFRKDVSNQWSLMQFKKNILRKPKISKQRKYFNRLNTILESKLEAEGLYKLK